MHYGSRIVTVCPLQYVGGYMLRFFCTVLILFGCFELFAQNTPEATGQGESVLPKVTIDLNKNPKSSYLDVFHAKQYASRLHKEHGKSIHTLKVIIANFGSEADKKSLSAISTDYGKVLRKVYTGRHVEAYRILLRMNNSIRSLFSTLSDSYYKRASQMLDLCTDKIVELELAESTEPGSEVYSNYKLIRKNKNRLAHAFEQIFFAEQMKSLEYYTLMISHLRSAKSYAIAILRDTAATSQDRKQTLTRYKIDSEDTNNIIARK